MQSRLSPGTGLTPFDRPRSNDSPMVMLAAAIQRSQTQSANTGKSRYNSQDVVESVEQQVTKLRREAVKLFVSGQNGAAIQLFTEALQINLGDATLWAERASCWLRFGDADRAALNDAKKSLEIDPNLFLGHYRKGQALYNLHQYLPAIESLENAMNLCEPRSSFERPLENLLTSAKHRLKIAKLSDPQARWQSGNITMHVSDVSHFNEAVADHQLFIDSFEHLANESATPSVSSAIASSVALGQLNPDANPESRLHVCWEAFLMFQKGLRIGRQVVEIPMAGGREAVAIGKQGALKALTTALMLDPECFVIVKGLWSLVRKVVVLEKNCTSTIFNIGPDIDVQEIKNHYLLRLMKNGWADVRPSLSVTLRTTFLMGFLLSATAPSSQTNDTKSRRLSESSSASSITAYSFIDTNEPSMSAIQCLELAIEHHKWTIALILAARLGLPAEPPHRRGAVLGNAFLRGVRLELASAALRLHSLKYPTSNSYVQTQLLAVKTASSGSHVNSNADSDGLLELAESESQKVVESFVTGSKSVSSSLDPSEKNVLSNTEFNNGSELVSRPMEWFDEDIEEERDDQRRWRRHLWGSQRARAHFYLATALSRQGGMIWGDIENNSGQQQPRFKSLDLVFKAAVESGADMDLNLLLNIVAKSAHYSPIDSHLRTISLYRSIASSTHFGGFLTKDLRTMITLAHESDAASSHVFGPLRDPISRHQLSLLRLHASNLAGRLGPQTLFGPQESSVVPGIGEGGLKLSEGLKGSVALSDVVLGHGGLRKRGESEKDSVADMFTPASREE
ncbi:hypothetical protein HDU76_000189 [Blyttiomyces sp. JEL0837]|nr:hypothetical protein HDU76_000189 [Blyttiomyces sp. JEL0837]